MIKIIDKSSTGKTKKLMELAKKDNAWFVCQEPEKAIMKAHEYNIIGLKFMSYPQYWAIISGRDTFEREDKFYIDDLNIFLKSLDYRIQGYSMTVE